MVFSKRKTDIQLKSTVELRRRRDGSCASSDSDESVSNTASIRTGTIKTLHAIRTLPAFILSSCARRSGRVACLRGGGYLNGRPVLPVRVRGGRRSGGRTRHVRRFPTKRGVSEQYVPRVVFRRRFPFDNVVRLVRDSAIKTY